MAGASRVSVASGSGMAAEGRYEGRLTTAREGYGKRRDADCVNREIRAYERAHRVGFGS